MLRLYRNRGNLPHVRFEHEVLQQLDQAPLSFQVPVPLSSRNGDTLVPVDLEGETYFASLFALIPGEHPSDWSNRVRLRAAGAALGELDRVLAALEPAGTGALPLYRDLDRIHSGVPDPEAAVAALPIDGAQRNSFLTFLARVRGSGDGLYRALPRQVIHSDFDGSNMLYTGDRVSGILDFEFASFDLRAMDLAVALMQIASHRDPDALDLEVVRVLAAAYRTEIVLTPAEIEAIPDLIRLRGAVTVIHRLGRWKLGLSPVNAVESRIRHNLALDEWLDRNHDVLVAASLEALAEGGHGGTEDVVFHEQPEEAPEDQ